MEADDAPSNIFLSTPHTHRHRSSSLSNVPALRITTSSVTPNDPTSPLLPEFKRPQHLSKAQSELTKLLVHHLSRLKSRPQPPSVFAPLRTTSSRKPAPKLAAVVDTVKFAVRLNSSSSQPQSHTSTSLLADELPSSEFSTETTYDYLVQLRDLLNVSEKQGMRILHASFVSFLFCRLYLIFIDTCLLLSDIDSTVTSRGRTTVRRVKNSPQRPRSLSASTSDHPHRIELLHECIEILRTVISEDARFKNLAFRPTRPPYGLQTVVLDIAHILVTTYRHDPSTLSHIGLALIPAFYSFNPVLHTRLFRFFEGGIIRYMLDELHIWRGMEPVLKSTFSSFFMYIS